MIFLTILLGCIAFVAMVWCLFQVSRWWLGRSSRTGGFSASPMRPEDGVTLDAHSGPILDSNQQQHTPFQGHYLATACDLAYLPEAEARVRFREELNLDARLISVDNTQVYVCQNAESIVVAFRGSEIPGSIDGFKDWLLTNARNFLVIPEGRLGTDFAAAGVGARFHRGFMEALAEVWPPLHQTVDEVMRFRERPLWITGHSLGGAIALMAAWRLHQHFIPVHRICTFGAPMVGNAKAAEAYAKEFPGKIVRYVDFNDMVPKLPTMSLLSNHYNHVQRELVLGEQEEPTALSLAGPTNESDSADGSISHAVAEEVWGNVQSRIASHLMDNYLAQINQQLD